MRRDSGGDPATFASVSTLNGQWLDAFRAGNYDRKGEYSIADLAALCANYDPAKHEAPIVIGHPKLDGPAFGWVKAARMNGDVLQLQAGEVDPTFEAEVKAGKFKKRSIAFETLPDGSLKKPLELRHIGFLGAVPPHVKGLRDAHFSDASFDEIEFSDSSEGEDMNEEQVKKTIADSIKEFFAQFAGPKTAATITQADIEAATKAATERIEARFADDLKKEREARQAIELQFADHKKQTGNMSATQRAAALVAGLKAKSRWLPAYDRMGVPEIFAALATNVTTEIEFSVADGQNVKKDAATTFADFLEGLGQIVPQGVTFSAGKLEAPKAAPDGNGVDVDPASVTFNAQVEAYSVEHKMPYADAYRELSKKGVRPISGDASAGAV